MNPEEYYFLKKKIKQLTQLELDNYSSKQMMRRLDGYIVRCRANSVAHYCQMLEKDRAEVEKLQDFLTINVSEFFRDAAHFKMLKEKILPELLKNTLQLNIWSAGCSIGAEAYSTAILLERLSPYRTHRILATDIDKNALAHAAAGGPYRPADVRNVPQDLLGKYFTQDGDHYWIKKRMCSKVVFRQHDLTRDPFEGGFDLIMCRNVVIYFTDETKKKLRKQFIEALKFNGILFIGATETMLDANETGMVRMSPCFYKKTIEAQEKSRLLSLSAK